MCSSNTVAGTWSAGVHSRVSCGSVQPHDSQELTASSKAGPDNPAQHDDAALNLETQVVGAVNLPDLAVLECN